MTLGVEVDPPGKRSCSLFFVLFPWGNLQNTNRRLITWTYNNYIPFDPRTPYKLLLGKHQSWNAVWKNPPKNKWRNNILSWIFAKYWRKKTVTVSFLNIFLFLLKKKKCHDSITLKSCESRCNFAPLDSISIALPHPFPKARTCTKYFPKKSTKNVVLHFTLSKRSLVFCLCVSALENHLLIKGCSHILLPRTPLVFHRYTLSQPPYWRGQPQMQLNSIASGLLKKEGIASVLTIPILIQ